MIVGSASPEELLRQLIQATHHRDRWHERVITCGSRPLDALVDHAVRTVPFYQRWASANGLTNPTFRRLPIVAKPEMRKDPDAFRSAAFNRLELHWETTSGTTGVPLKVCFDPAGRYYDIYEIYLKIRSFMPQFANSLRGADNLVVIVNDNITREPLSAIHPELVSGAMHLLILGRSDAEDEELVQQLRKSHIPLLSGPPRALSRLRDLDSKVGGEANPIRPHAILSTGDNLYGGVRRRLEAWFLCSVHNGYASQEAGLLGVECGSQTGIHVICDGAVVEILTEDGKLRREGSGEMVITNLTNWAMPFIRYSTGDNITLVNQTCVCGQSGLMITELAGRDSVHFVFANDRFNPSLLNPVFESLPVEQFQVIQELDGSLYVRVVISEGVLDPRRIEQAVREGIEREIGKVKIRIEHVLQIGRTGEKFQSFVRKAASQTEVGTEPISL